MAAVPKEMQRHCITYLNVREIINTVLPVCKQWQQLSVSVLLEKAKLFQPHRMWQSLLQELDAYFERCHFKLQQEEMEFYWKVIFLCCKYPSLSHEQFQQLQEDFYKVQKGNTQVNKKLKKECLFELLVQFEKPNEALLVQWKREHVEKKKKNRKAGVKELIRKMICCCSGANDSDAFIPYEQISWKFLLQCLCKSYHFYRHHKVWLPQKSLRITSKLTGNAVNRVKNDLSRLYKSFCKKNSESAVYPTKATQPINMEIVEKDEASELLDSICNVDIEFYNSDVTLLCYDFSKDFGKLEEQIQDCVVMTERVNPKLVLLAYRFSKLLQDQTKLDRILSLCQRFSVQIFVMEEVLQESEEPILFEFIFQSTLLHLNKLFEV